MKILKYNCCLPGSTNSLRSKPSMFKFYCIPKDTELQKRYNIMQRSRLTQQPQEYVPIIGKIVKELCRSHLPSIFPWSKLK